VSEFFALFASMWKEIWRDKFVMFFSLAFPVMFLVMFGYIFGGGGGELKTAVVTTDTRLAEFGDIYSSLDEIKGYYHEIAVVEEGKITFLRKTSDTYYQPVLDGWEMSLKNAVERLRSGLKPVVKVQLKPVRASHEPRPFDYTLTGVIAISLLSMGLFGSVEVFSVYREKGVLKRLKVTPVEPFSFALGLVSSRLCVGIISTVLILVLGEVLFGVRYQMNVWLFIASIVSSTLSFIGLGILISFAFKKPETALEFSVILFTMMMFLSGVYFPLTFLPNFLRAVSWIFPVKYGVETIRYSFGFKFITPTQLSVYLSALFVFGLVLIYFAAKKIFERE